MVPIAMLAMIVTSPGQTFGVAVFNPYWRSSLGLSHSQLTGAYMAGTLAAALPQPAIGGLMDRFGMRRVMAVVVILLGLACLLMSQVQGLLMLFFAFFLLRLLGQGALGLMAVNTLAMWFQARLGTVAGLMNATVAAAVAVIPALFLFLIDAFDWRGAYAALGVLVWLLMLPLLLLLYRNRPRDVGQKLDGGPAEMDGPTVAEPANAPSFTLTEARHTRAYWILILYTIVWALIITAVFFNIVPIFANRGLNESLAATTFATVAMAMAAAQLTGGVLADRLPLHWLAAACLLFITAAVWMLNLAGSPGEAQFYALLMGIGQGLAGAVNNTVWVRYYGRAHLGHIRGTVAMAQVGGSSIGPFIMGATYDLTGSYQFSLYLFVGLLLPLAAACLWATPPRTNRA